MSRKKRDASDEEEQPSTSPVLEPNVDVSEMLSRPLTPEEVATLKSMKLPPLPSAEKAERFRALLLESRSLTFRERKSVVERYRTLSQFQREELLRIFEEEQRNLRALWTKKLQKKQRRTECAPAPVPRLSDEERARNRAEDEARLAELEQLL